MKEQGDYKATLRSLYSFLEAKFSCTALIHNCSIKLMQFDHKIWIAFGEGSISHTTNFYAFCLKHRIRHTPLTGTFAKALYHRAFQDCHLILLIPKPPLPEVTFNKQHIPKIYYPMAGILPRMQNRRRVAGERREAVKSSTWSLPALKHWLPFAPLFPS